MRTKQFSSKALTLILALMLLFSLTGCGEKQTIAQDPTPPPPALEVDLPSPEDDLAYSSLSRVAPFLEEFKAVEEAGFIHYTYIGDELIDGVETSKVTLSYDDSQKLTVWVSAEGLIQKAVSDPENILTDMLEYMNETEFADMWFAPLLNILFRYDGASIDDILTAIGMNFGAYNIVNVEPLALGELYAEVYTVEFTRDEPERLIFADFGFVILGMRGDKVRDGAWKQTWEVTKFSLR